MKLLYYLPKIVLALSLFGIGLWLIKQITYLVREKFAKNIDPTITPFLVSMLTISLKVVLILSILQLFFDISPFISIISSLGFAISLSFQNAIASLVNGFLLIILKPFKVGDRITSGEITGNVEKIQSLTTVLRTLDNKLIYLENSQLLGNPLVNHSAFEAIMVIMFWDVSPSEEISEVREVIKNVALKSIFLTKNTEILINKFSGDSTTYEVRLWCKPENYWDVYYYMTENVKQAFTFHKIELPIEDLKVDYEIILK